jgi:hypothetical protein
MRTPQTRCLFSPCSRATAQTRPRPWTQSQPPVRRTGGPNTSPGWIEGNYPPERSEARRIARMAKSFTIVDELYKRVASGVLQRYVPIPQGHELLRDIHACVCGHHAAPRTLIGNTFHQGFYWPTAVADANEIVRTCEGCQLYARKTNLPAHALQMILVTWPFAVWGLDIVGPL